MQVHDSDKSLRLYCYGKFREMNQNMTNSVLFKFEDIGWTSWGSVIIGSEKYITQAREVLAGDLLSMVYLVEALGGMSYVQ